MSITLTPSAQAADIAGLVSYMRRFGLVPLEVSLGYFPIGIIQAIEMLRL